MIQEIAPIMKSAVCGPAATIACITYRGDVPISPNTIPRVTRTPARLNFFRLPARVMFIKIREKNLAKIYPGEDNYPPSSKYISTLINNLTHNHNKSAKSQF